MPKAIVVGAGIAGCVTALAVQRAGWEVEVAEAYAHSDGLGQGAFLTLAVNGMDALRAVGAADAVAGLGFRTGAIRFTSGTGKPLGDLPIGPVRPDGAATRTVLRTDLYAALHALVVERGIPVRHDRRLVAATVDTTGVVATFADGDVARADLLVGADGLRSTVRTLLDVGAPVPQPMGIGNVGGVAPAPDAGVAAQGADGDYRMIWGRRCFFGYTVAPDGEVWWFANPPGTWSGREADGQAALVDLLVGDAGPAAAIVAGTTAPILFGDTWSLPAVPVWQRGRIVLVGDAAHPVAPSSGQGASLAMEDAVVLAHALTTHADPPEAAAAYVAARRERVERIRRWGARTSNVKVPGPVGRVVRDAMMPAFMRLAASPKAQARQAWVFEHHAEPVGAPAVVR